MRMRMPSSMGNDYVTSYALERIDSVNKTLKTLKGGMLTEEEENQLRKCRELLKLKAHPLDCALEGTRNRLIAKINKILGEDSEAVIELQSTRLVR